MKKEAVNHIPKSHMAYAMDKQTLHIYLQAAKNDLKSVKLVIGDPFDWRNIEDVYRWSGKQELYMKVRYETDLFDYFFAEVNLPLARAKYCFILNDGHKDYFYGSRDLTELTFHQDSDLTDNLFGFFNYPYINEGDLYRAPEWVKDTIWYQIFPDRFSRDDDDALALEKAYFSTKRKGDYKFGGTLKGIIKKIPYLKDLGINGIYLTPIFKAFSSHKYDTEDYYNIDPDFGTNDDLKQLIDICHDNHIKVMLDAVFNHCGYEHPFFQDVLINKKASPYWDWFLIDESAFEKQNLSPSERPKYRHVNFRPSYRTFAFSPVMPKWNIDNEDTEKYLIDIGKYWVEKYDIDGWRLDVSNEVSHRFWRNFRREMKSIKPDLYILGENWDDSKPWLQGDQFDAVMNYELSYRLWDLVSVDNSLLNSSISDFIFKINQLLFSYPDYVTPNMFNMLSSHDTKRLLIRCEGNRSKFKLYYLLMFIFSGSPMIYYGDEISLGEARDTDLRRPMIWDDRQDKEMLNFFRKLIHIRHLNEDLKQLDIEWLYHHESCLYFCKKNTLILLNFSSKDVTINLPDYHRKTRTIDLFSGRKIDVASIKKLSPYQCFILKI